MTDIVHLLQYGFIQKAFVAGIFVSIVCAILGVFLVLRRWSLIGDGLSHVSFGAVAVGLFLGWYPLYVSLPLVIIASLFILRLTEKSGLFGDAAIGIVSAVGLSTGVVLASVGHGFNVDLLSYLFGNILAISTEEMVTSIILSLVLLFIIIFLYHDLVALSFQEDAAKVSGVKTKWINNLLVVLTAIVVVLSIRVVGILLISALLILPAATALQLQKSFKMTIMMASVFAILSVISGILLSFYGDIPAGATIVLVNFIFFITAFLFRKK
jgi:zinc transport system permease protein